MEQEASDPTTTSSNKWKCCIRIDKKKIVSLLAGQVLSIFICGTAVASEVLTRNNVSIPVAQNFVNYYMLAMIYGVIAVYRTSPNIWRMLTSYGWQYALAAVIDVEANYLLVKAYQYTSMTSVQLIDCLTIPSVLLLSRFILGARYHCSHLAGVGLCLVGVGGMILADHITKGSSFSGANPILGDLFVAAGALLYGVSNVLQEYLIRKHSKIEYLGFVGIFASVVNAAQFLILERNEVSRLVLFPTTPSVWLCLAGFSLCMFLLYSCLPCVMEKSSAVLVNLSLLTADIYALILGVVVFHYAFHPLYFIAYVVIMVGVAAYSVRPPKMPPVEGPSTAPLLAQTFKGPDATVENVLTAKDVEGARDSSRDECLEMGGAVAGGVF